MLQSLYLSTRDKKEVVNLKLNIRILLQTIINLDLIHIQVLHFFNYIKEIDYTNYQVSNMI